MQNIDFLILRDYFIDMEKLQRTCQGEIVSKLFKGKAILIYGPRQSGKTTLVKQIIEKQSFDPVILNGDDDMDAALFETVTMSRWQQILGNKKCVFIDEGQKIKNIGRGIKLLVDARSDVQVIVTGSSSFELATQTEEPLTGRKYEYHLYPLTFAELSEHFGFLEERKKLELRLIYGSYPEVAMHEDSMKEILKLVSQSYLYKDLFQYEGIRKPQVLEKLLKALALQCGNEVSTNELSALLGVSRTLIDSYLKLLVQAFIIFPLNSYSTNLRNELKKSQKYYFWDNGIRNAVLSDFTPVVQREDTGALWENYLVSERLKKNAYLSSEANPYFWRTADQMEVDFLEVQGKKIEAYEFKWNPDKKSRVSRAFTNRYPEAIVKTITPENYDDFLGIRKGNT